MLVCGQEFTLELIDRISQTLEETPSISRRALSRDICEWAGWTSPNGKPKDMSCRKALLELDRRGIIALPRSTRRYSFQQVADTDRSTPPKAAEVDCELSELGQIGIEIVTSRYSKASKKWKELMNSYHYLGSGPLCGAQIRYLITSSKYGYLGGVSFSAAAWALKDRDRYIGWTEAARRANLCRVVCNSRFLILPSVKVKNLASYILSQCAKRLARDWIARYSIEPVLLESFVDPQRFTGASYRAANWVHVGQSTGRRAEQKEDGAGPKDIYLYALCKNWREILCTAPEIFLGDRPRPEYPQDWVEEEFGTVELYDSRLKSRLFSLARDFYGQPQAPIPQACESAAKTKAAYRFFENDKITMQTLLRAHVESTVERIKEHKIVLAVQDSSTLNYTAHPATEGLGPINTMKDGAVGLLLHDTMAFTEDGTPLGLLDAQCWARDPKDKGKSQRRKQLPIEQKESMKWLKSYRAAAEVQKLCPETMLVSVGDRESDIYELFLEACKDPKGPKLLVRCDQSHNRKVDELHLWERMCNEPVAGYQKVRVPRKGSRPARDAKLEVRYAKLTLKPPRSKDYKPVTVWIVWAREIDYNAEVKSPLDWMLLSTVEVTTFEQAIERLQWYTKRWGIEVYHRTLKSGCKIKDRRLGTAHRLEACLAIDMVVAWRIHHLTKLGRETPDVPCTVFFEEAEWKALYTFKNKTFQLPEKEPSLREVMRMTASLGGFLGRKGDGEPGTITLWRGLQRLEDITAMYIALLPHLKSGP